MNRTDQPLRVRTRVAHAGFEDHQFCGRRVFAELAGRTSTAGMLALALTGRMLSPTDCALIDDIIACGTMADPRIWPLKITRILGAYGRLIPAVAGGYLATEEAAVGPASVQQAGQQLVELQERVEGREGDLEAVAEALQQMRQRTPQLAGFGVPFRPRDERLAALQRCVHARERQLGVHWTLLESLLTISRRGPKKLELNVGSGIAALGLDLGFEPAMLPALASLVVAPCFYANAREAVQEPAAVLRELPVHRVTYVGAAPRQSPRALATGSKTQPG